MMKKFFYLILAICMEIIRMIFASSHDSQAVQAYCANFDRTIESVFRIGDYLLLAFRGDDPMIRWPQFYVYNFRTAQLFAEPVTQSQLFMRGSKTMANDKSENQNRQSNNDDYEVADEDNPDGQLVFASSFDICKLFPDIKFDLYSNYRLRAKRRSTDELEAKLRDLNSEIRRIKEWDTFRSDHHDMMRQVMREMMMIERESHLAAITTDIPLGANSNNKQYDDNALNGRLDSLLRNLTSITQNLYQMQQIPMHISNAAIDANSTTISTTSSTLILDQSMDQSMDQSLWADDYTVDIPIISPNEQRCAPIVIATFLHSRISSESAICYDYDRAGRSWFKTAFYRVLDHHPNSKQSTHYLPPRAKPFPRLSMLDLPQSLQARLLRFRGMIASNESAKQYLLVRADLSCAQKRIHPNVKRFLAGFRIDDQVFVQNRPGKVKRYHSYQTTTLNRQQQSQEIFISELLNCSTAKKLKSDRFESLTNQISLIRSIDAMTSEPAMIFDYHHDNQRENEQEDEEKEYEELPEAVEQADYDEKQETKKIDENMERTIIDKENYYQQMDSKSFMNNRNFDSYQPLLQPQPPQPQPQPQPKPLALPQKKYEYYPNKRLNQKLTKNKFQQQQQQQIQSKVDNEAKHRNTASSSLRRHQAKKIIPDYDNKDYLIRSQIPRPLPPPPPYNYFYFFPQSLQQYLPTTKSQLIWVCLAFLAIATIYAVYLCCRSSSDSEIEKYEGNYYCDVVDRPHSGRRGDARKTRKNLRRKAKKSSIKSRKSLSKKDRKTLTKRSHNRPNRKQSKSKSAKKMDLDLGPLNENEDQIQRNLIERLPPIIVSEDNRQSTTIESMIDIESSNQSIIVIEPEKLRQTFVADEAIAARIETMFEESKIITQMLQMKKKKDNEDELLTITVQKSQQRTESIRKLSKNVNQNEVTKGGRSSKPNILDLDTINRQTSAAVRIVKSISTRGRIALDDILDRMTIRIDKKCLSPSSPSDAITPINDHKNAIIFKQHNNDNDETNLKKP